MNNYANCAKINWYNYANSLSRCKICSAAICTLFFLPVTWQTDTYALGLVFLIKVTTNVDTTHNMAVKVINTNTTVTAMECSAINKESTVLVLHSLGPSCLDIIWSCNKRWEVAKPRNKGYTLFCKPGINISKGDIQACACCIATCQLKDSVLCESCCYRTNLMGFLCLVSWQWMSLLSFGEVIES